MDEEALPNVKHNCCKNNRGIFTVLVVTTAFFFMIWNLNIPYKISVSGNNFYWSNLSEYIYIKNIFTHPPPAADTGRNYINPHDYEYIILEKNTCNSENQSVFLMVVVCVAPANFKQRMTIRDTWGYVAKSNKEIRLIFMIGKTLESNIQQQLINESNTFHDLVQEDFLDSYRNLSYKSVAMLKWSYIYCPIAKYILKADDDMFVNLEYLLNVLKHKNYKNAVIGFQINGARPIQDKNSKWYTPKETYNGTFYPPYCSGTSYVISGDAVEKIYKVSLDTKYFWLEDVYITGICRTKANVTIQNDYGFTYDKRTATGCEFKNKITGHRYTELEIRQIWKQFTDKTITCNHT